MAPWLRASSSFAGSRSTAIDPGRRRRAMPRTPPARPTPPQPITATVSPTLTPAALRTAPTPVITLQPTSAASHSGSSSGTGTAAAAGTTHRSAKHGDVEEVLDVARRPEPVQAGAAVRQLAGRACSPPPARTGSCCPARHCGQAAAGGDEAEARRGRPRRHVVTPAPTASTTPAPSWPSTIGWRSVPRCPSARCRSEWQTPAAATRTSTSPARGGVQAQLLDPDSGSPIRSSTAARTRIWPLMPTRHRSSASRSGSTPRPGPAGGAIVPSAAISTGAGSSQSRRSAVQAGGSNGTST